MLVLVLGCCCGKDVGISLVAVQLRVGNGRKEGDEEVEEVNRETVCDDIEPLDDKHAEEVECKERKRTSPSGCGPRDKAVKQPLLLFGDAGKDRGRGLLHCLPR
eukprot:130370_1